MAMAKTPPGAPPGPDSALPDAHEHPGEPDPEQGVAAVVQHSGGCQSLPAPRHCLIVSCASLLRGIYLGQGTTPVGLSAPHT